MHPNQPTPASREACRRELRALFEQFVSAGREIETIEHIEADLPQHSGQIDPETKPRHKGYSRAEIALHGQAAPIIHRFRWHGMQAIRERLNEAGIGMPPKRVELIAARHGILIAEAA